MSEYKDITPLKKQIKTLKQAVFSSNSDYMTGYLAAISAVEEVISELPDADVQEVKHGKWIKVGVGITERIVCSQCKSDKGSYMKPMLCNQCGARMDGDKM